MAPKIDKKALSDIKVKAGLKFEFDVPFVGEPMPDISWTKETKKLLSEDRIKISNTG